MEESARRRTGAFRAGWNWLGLALSGLLMLAASPALAQDAAGGRPSASGMATPLFSAPWATRPYQQMVPALPRTTRRRCRELPGLHRH